MKSIEEMTLKLDQYFLGLIEAKRIPGCGLKVRKDGELIYDKCFGLADIDSNLPVDDFTVFTMASLTKPVTAVAAMRLVEEGKLSLDDDLLKFFPSYPEEKKAVTVRHLLNHCSGLGQGPASNVYFVKNSRPGDSLGERIERFGNMPFDFRPCESAAYSPVVGFEILGRIIEIASGMRLEDYMQERILRPLGMPDTSFYLTSERSSRLASTYNSVDGSLMKLDTKNAPVFSLVKSNEHYNSGSGGLYSTLHDYDRFTHMLFNGGELDGYRVISEESLRLMRTTHQLTAANAYSPGLAWGLGFLVFEDPAAAHISVAPGTFGWSGAYGTHIFVNTETGLCATYMVSMGDLGGGASPISRKIESIVFE
ncbi:MAG: beta-lactamase family protein [Lachnospiraceae bacterium]|nr:beta-lactamase family protein [Lachnospiraceae bacterium]